MEKSNSEKRISTTRLILPALFIVFSIILEIANFLYFGFENSSGARMVFPTYFLFDLAVILMLAGFIFVLQNKVAVCVAFCLILFLQTAICILNVTLYSIFGEVFSMALLKLGNEAKAAFDFDLIDWAGTLINLGLYIVMLITGILITCLNKSTYSVKHFSAPIIALAVFIFVESFGTSLFYMQKSFLRDSTASENEIEASDLYLWNNVQFKNEAYKKFGFYGFYLKEIFNKAVPEKVTADEVVDYVKYIDDGHVEGNTKAPLYGDNLIVILCETLDMYGIDPYNTPTLWSMWEGEYSISFKNFYARNRTNNSEGITLLGSMPKESSIKNAYNNGYEFRYSLPRLFKQSGDENVITTYAHSNVSTFYNRNVTHGADGIGFDRLYTWEDYSEDKIGKWGDWNRDVDFIEEASDVLLPTNQRFLSYFTSLSTHGPWTTEKQHMPENYEIYDANLDGYKIWLEENGFVWPEDETNQKYLRNFKAGTIDLDKTVERLLEMLDERGLSENTSILLFADHNAYYHDMCFKMRDIKKADYFNVEPNHIPAMFYSPKLVGKDGMIIEDFCNTYDLLPTICQLYGMPSNTNIFPGHSILSEEIKDSFFASHLGGMFTKDIYSQNITDLYIRGDNVTEEDIKRFRENAYEFYKKQEYLEKIYFSGINGTKI